MCNLSDDAIKFTETSCYTNV